MNSQITITHDAGSTPVMTADIAKLIVELTQQLDAAYGELDEAKLDASTAREQRSLALAEAHRLHRVTRQQATSYAAICDRSRAQQREILALREQVAQLERDLDVCTRGRAA